MNTIRACITVVYHKRAHEKMTQQTLVKEKHLLMIHLKYHFRMQRTRMCKSGAQKFRTFSGTIFFLNKHAHYNKSA